MRPLAALAAVMVLAVPTVGDAQSRGSSADAPIGFGSDDIEYAGDTVTLTGRVELTQGQNRLRANRVSGLSLSGEQSRLEASGDVYFVTPRETIRGDRAVYTTATGIIVVTGDVILTQGQNVITGSRLTYNVRTETARLEGGGDGRVRGVFYPENDGG